MLKIVWHMFNCDVVLQTETP